MTVDIDNTFCASFNVFYLDILKTECLERHNAIFCEISQSFLYFGTKSHNTLVHMVSHHTLPCHCPPFCFYFS